MDTLARDLAQETTAIRTLATTGIAGLDEILGELKAKSAKS
jgi:hypothetical protein